jgi:hypothetical protein
LGVAGDVAGMVAVVVVRVGGLRDMGLAVYGEWWVWVLRIGRCFGEEEVVVVMMAVVLGWVRVLWWGFVGEGWLLVLRG